MVSVYAVIVEDFEEELQAIRILVAASADPKQKNPRTRVAGANAAMLLLAATFEEFVREMARAFAREVVASCESYNKLPAKLASTAWKRAMDALARVHLDPKTEVFSRESIFSDALTRFTVVYEFCKGDLSQDVYEDLIHNDNNMRPNEINGLFKLSGLNNICQLSADCQRFIIAMNETEPGKAHGRLLDRLENFFERRNQVAHSINAMRSNGPEQILSDVEFLMAFGQALLEALELRSPTVKVVR